MNWTIHSKFATQNQPMSDPIKHECGIAFIRLRKPLDEIREKYGSALYGIHKMKLLMAKQLNRGQDGAGLGVIKLNPQYGNRYIARKRSNDKNSVAQIFEEIEKKYSELDQSKLNDTQWVKDNFPYAGDLLVGHLRYGTHGSNSIENLHPFLRQNNWMSRNLVLAGNHNMTNVDEMFQLLIDLGQHPKEMSDNVTMLEKIGHFLDEENASLFNKYRSEGMENLNIAENIKNNLDLENVLKRSFKNVDGGYNMVGMVGHGDAFIIRDPSGIRPSFYYYNDDVFAMASERPALQTAFNLKKEEVKELGPGNAMIIKRDGSISEVNITPPTEQQSCTFERIYFSRGNDSDIYVERKRLGRRLAPQILERINHDVRNTVFSYIPNTAATCFYGMVDGIYGYVDDYKRKALLDLNGNMSEEKIDEILSLKARREKILIKDVKMRTFITNDDDREDLVGNVYDVTYGIVRRGKDTLVVVDDSIVRGTTLKTSILRILDRLGPKKVIVASSAPQIRFPDCYGIDMSRMNEFVAFRAVLSLLEKDGKKGVVLEEIYKKCKAEMEKPVEETVNHVKSLYDHYSTDEITAEIARIVTPEDMKAEVELVYQTIEDLHKACPKHKGDWYFTGNYPTPGGNRVVNRSFIYFMEGITKRAY
jgi:amidophosphoribosyltransferase